MDATNNTRTVPAADGRRKPLVEVLLKLNRMPNAAVNRWRRLADQREYSKPNQN